VKVADFSIARAATEDDPGRTGEVLGVDGYLAPEVVSGDDADGRADVYGLGACLYEMLTGRAPGADPSTTIPPRALRAGVPRDLDTIVRQAMAVDPGDRFQTVQVMAGALSRSAVGPDSVPPSEFLPVPPAPTGPGVSSSRGFLRHEGRLLGWVLALVAVAAVLVTVGLTFAKNDLGDLFGEDPPSNTRRTPTTAAPTTPIRGVTGASYDPLGDDRTENEDEAPNAVDGNLDTVWRTVRYNSSRLGGLKPGVGFVLSLRSPEEARQLNLTLTAAGADFTVYGTNDETIPDQFVEGSGWTQVGKQDDATAKPNVKLSGGPQRHYLVWFTDLPQDGGGYRIGIAEAGLRS
jgi:serine/threonine protein kinase